MTKSLSIVIPACNEEHLLKGCLEAIVRQTVAPDEVIVVDNNSTDRTAAVAAGFSFVTVVHEQQQGIVYARNRGFDLSRGDIIGRIDADTILPPDWVETVKVFYDNPAHIGQTINGSCRFYNLHSGAVIGAIYNFVVHRMNRLIMGYYFPWGSNMALPADMWRNVREKVCVRTDYHEDLDLGIHLHEAGGTAQYLPKMRVGAVARRIMTERGHLWGNLRMWQYTMRQHRFVLWPLSVPLSVGIWLGSYGVFAIEYVWNKLFGPRPV